MGGSFWHYWVPYEADIEAALERLRDRVFAEGSYYSGFGEQQVVSPTSIEDVFDQLDEMGSADGTHSILDVGSIDPEPAYGVVAPLTETQLIELFATAKPTRAQVDAKLRKRAASTGSHQPAAEAITCDRNGEPGRSRQ